MIYRFGEGFGGQFARIVSAIAAFASTIGMLAYMVKGIEYFYPLFYLFSFYLFDDLGYYCDFIYPCKRFL